MTLFSHNPHSMEKNQSRFVSHVQTSPDSNKMELMKTRRRNFFGLYRFVVKKILY